LWLIYLPGRQLGINFTIGIAALASGVSAALVWISGMSLVQNVPDSKRGRSNSLFLISIGIGSIAGPIMGRMILAASRMVESHSLTGFFVILWIGTALSLAGSAIVYFWGEHPHPTGMLLPDRVVPTFMDDLRLFRSPRFLIMIIPIGLLSGPVFQAANVYVAYRAKEPNIGLILHSQDHGWVALQITGYIMQLLGGFLVGRIAGKKVSHYVAAVLIASYALCAIGIGLSPGAVMLIVFVALFEVFRQFARWMQTGYISEHVPSNQRSAAMGATVMISGLGGTSFMFLSRYLQSPDSPSFSSTTPFMIAGSLALLGVVILLVGGYRLLRTEQVDSKDILDTR
jgi:MFS family permease